MRAVNPSTAHQARIITQKMTRYQRNPRGNYDPSPYQWGYVHSINTGPPPSVNLYLDGTQTLSDTSYLTNNVRYNASYTPTVGDVVLVARGTGKSSSDRTVILKLAGSPTPTFTPFSSYNTSTSQYTLGPNGMWGGSGVPPTTIGVSGDYYFRTDTPTVANQRLYVNQSGTWVGIL